MDLLQLELFLAVVEERSFTRASARVGRTQPAVSQSIKKLEEEVGAPLFARGVHDVSLTEAGEVLAEHARKIVRTRDDARRGIRALKTLKAGTIDIAAHESAAVYLLPVALREYLRRFPDVKVGIYRSRLTDIPRQVIDREIHVGFVKDEPGFHELKCLEVHADNMVLVVPPRHPLATHSDVRVRDLAGERFVLHHGCSATEEKIQRLFDEYRTPLHVAAELWSFENVKTFVQAGVGLAIVPRLTVRQELHDRRLVEVPVKELVMPRRTLMIYRDQGQMSEASLELIKVVRTFNWGHVGPRPARRAQAADGRR